MKHLVRVQATGGAGGIALYRDKRTCRKCFFSNDRLTVLGHRAKGIKHNPGAENTHWLRREDARGQMQS